MQVLLGGIRVLAWRKSTVRCAYLTIGLTLTAICSSVQAVDFSFAGASDPGAMIFEQQQNLLTAFDNDAFVNLYVDLDPGGSGDPILFEQSAFKSIIYLSYEHTEALPGNLFLQTFKAEGTFSLWEECSCRMMFYCDFQQAVFTSVSDRPDMIGSSATLQGADLGLGLVYYAPGPVLMDFGVTQFYAPFDFSFTLSNINGGAGAQITNGVISAFTATADYSGSAFIPAPSAALPILIGTLAHASRRRR